MYGTSKGHLWDKYGCVPGLSAMALLVEGQDVFFTGNRSYMCYAAVYQLFIARVYSFKPIVIN
ncbi:MAG: hypothetical protein V4604_05110 [Bacteroidota bacterium]